MNEDNTENLTSSSLSMNEILASIICRNSKKILHKHYHQLSAEFKKKSAQALASIICSNLKKNFAQAPTSIICRNLKKKFCTRTSIKYLKKFKKEPAQAQAQASAVIKKKHVCTSTRINYLQKFEKICKHPCINYL